MKKRSVTLRGHRTSITLEDEFWAELANIARRQKQPIQQLVTHIDETRKGNLSSALRVYILAQVKAGAPIARQ